MTGGKGRMPMGVPTGVAGGGKNCQAHAEGKYDGREATFCRALQREAGRAAGFRSEEDGVQASAARTAKQGCNRKEC